jgi:hypothetical protein
MRRTTKQIEEDLKEAILSGHEVINKAEITRKTSLQNSTIKRFLPNVYKKIVNNCKKYLKS